MLDDLQTWWQNTSPEWQTAAQNGGVLIAAVVGGYWLGSKVGRVLRDKKFDAALRLPGAMQAGAEPAHGITPTFMAVLLIRLTVWAAAAWWLAHKHGRVDVASTLGLVISRAWAVAGMLATALGLGSMLAQRLIDCLQSPQTGLEALSPRNGVAASPRNLAGAVGAGAYFLIGLLVLMIAADLFDWPLTRSVALALWQLAQHLLTAGAALVIGYLGAGWARQLVQSEGVVTPEKRAGQFTALGIVAATTVLAVGVILSNIAIFIGLATLVVFGLALWLVRGYLPDIAAGLQLRTLKVREVWFDGIAWQVAAIGIFTSQLERSGEIHSVPNRQVLEARFQEAPVGVAAE